MSKAKSTESHSRSSIEPDAFSIDEFVERHRICRASLYNLWKAGLGPKFFWAGTRRLISRESAALWRAERERDAAARQQQEAGAESEADNTTEAPEAIAPSRRTARPS